MSDPTTQGANWTGYASELSVTNYAPDAFEDALNYAAGIFGNIGLREPLLEPNLNDRNGFFVRSIGTDWGRFSPDCQKPDQDRSVLELNGPLLATKHGRSTTTTAAHELFHAVQHHYPFTKATNDPCVSPPAWIEEGQADAAGTFLAEEIWKILGPGADPFADEFGLRHYFLPLFEDLVAWKACYASFCLTNTSDFEEFQGLENYRSSSFWRFLMERIWEVRNEAYVHDSLQALALFMAFSPPDQTAHFRASNRKGKQPSDAWLDWVADIVNSMFGQAKSGGGGVNPAFHFVFAEFLTEFASWPLSKYKKSALSTDIWLQTAFNKCRKVHLSPGKSHIEDYSQGNSLGETPVYPVSGRCIEVTLEGFAGEVNLDIAAHAVSEDQADQLMMGLAYETDGAGGSADTCYEKAAGKKRGEYGCLYFGKVAEWYSTSGQSGTATARYTRTWRFEPRVMTGDKVVQTYVLSNVDPDKPSETEAIEEMEIAFSVDYVENSAGQQGYKVPEGTGTGVPDLATPKRDLLYGIQSRGAYSSLMPTNMAPFGFETLAAAPVKKGAVWPEGEARVVPAFFGPKPNANATEPPGISYGVLPLDEVAFGQLGALQGVVSRTDPAQPHLVAMSTLCAGADDRKPLEVLQSDRAALRVRVKTPICTTKTGDFLDCQNGCPVIETVDVAVSLGGGWRYFAENQPGDIVTPSVRYDIDRYHHEAFGEPLRLAPLPDLNNVPQGGFPKPTPTTAPQTTAAAPPCDCSCAAFDAIKALQANPALMLLPGNMQKLQCMGTCMSQFAGCP